MGIPGLTSYVATLPFGNGKVWEPYDLRDTNLIIDGCGLLYHIYGSNSLDIKCGGQYQEFKRKVREFLEKLRLNNVKPYVVIDGISTKDNKKFSTTVKRKQELIGRVQQLWSSGIRGYGGMVRPRLTQMAFIQVLREQGVQYAIADFEADCESASLANELHAPVMGNDSDFYMFNIAHGYIPFEQYDFSGSNVRVKKFSFNGFTTHLGIHPDMAPLLASLMGNDYISSEMLRPFTAHLSQPWAGTRSCKAPSVAQFLSKYKTVLEAFDAVLSIFPQSKKTGIKNALQLSIEEYQSRQSNLIGYFNSGNLDSNLQAYNDHPIPQWVIGSYRKGFFASEGMACLCNRKLFLQIQSEDISLPSAQICAQKLRWSYYALAMNCELVRRVESHTSESDKQRKVTTNMVTSKTDTYHSLAEEVRSLAVELEQNVQVTDTKDTLFPCYDDVRHASNKPARWNVPDTEAVTVAEFCRERATLIQKNIPLTDHVPKIKIQDILQMSDDAKMNHFLKLLGSNLPFIHSLPVEHQLVVSALRYWVVHAQVEQTHLAALLVYYIGGRATENQRSSSRSSMNAVSVEAVHGFSQWQNVLYWVEKFNSLFSYMFPQLEVANLYDGVHVCMLFARLKVTGNKFAESIVINTKLYRQLYDAVTKDLPRDCLFNQSQPTKRQTEGNRKPEQRSGIKSKRDT